MKITDPLYGTLEFPDYFGTLLSSPVLQRLRHIHQNGANYLVDNTRSATRYEHSIGVMMLAKMLGGDEGEQVAGLLHDISHTAFSHTIDFMHLNRSQDYHEGIKAAFIEATELPVLLKSLGFGTDVLEPEQFPRVKSKLPEIYADCLDYSFRDLLNAGRITKAQVGEIISSLSFNGRMQCASLATARLLFNKFLEFNSILFSPLNEVSNIALGKIMGSMMEQGLLSKDDLMATDNEIIAKIRSSRFATQLDAINPDMKFSISDKPTGFASVRKLRHIDPLVDGQLLTEQDSNAREKLIAYLKLPHRMYYNIGGYND